MIDSYDRAQNLKMKMKHFGIDQGDQEEVRQLMNNLMTLSEVVGLYDRVSFEHREDENGCQQGWLVKIEAPISRSTMTDFMLLLSDD